MSMIISTRKFHSSTSPLPPPLDVHAGARASWTAVPIIGKRLGQVAWRPVRTDSTIVDLIVLGDSYADDIDMGFVCWPSVLAQRRGWSILNAARGGSISGQGIAQYQRAIAFAEQAQLQVSGSTVCIVHLGGNNLLHALWLGPVAAALLVIDVASIGLGLLGYTRRLTDLPRLSFAGLLARSVLGDLGKLVRHLGGKGHTELLVCGLPVCAAIPTMRVVLSVLLWPLLLWPSRLWTPRGGGGAHVHSRAVSAVATDFAALAQSAIEAHVRSEAADAGVTLRFFDEAAAVMAVADEARRRERGSIFKDGHHPNEAAHARIVAFAEAALLEEAASATKAPPPPAQLAVVRARRKASPRKAGRE